jgi:hypothetical protein
MVVDIDLRNANIAIGVGLTVLISGCVLFRNAGDYALELVALAVLVATFGTLTLLYVREDRREERAKRDQ